MNVRRLTATFIALLAAPSAFASPIIDTFVFDNPGPLRFSGGNFGNYAISGSFTLDSSSLSVVTALTISPLGGPLFSSTGTPPPTTVELPTFDGAELIGNFKIMQKSLIYTLLAEGTFGPGATGGVYTQNSAIDGPSIIASDSGSITYTLVPEPTSLALLASALLVAWLRGRRRIGRLIR